LREAGRDHSRQKGSTEATRDLMPDESLGLGALSNMLKLVPMALSGRDRFEAYEFADQSVKLFPTAIDLQEEIWRGKLGAVSKISVKKAEEIRMRRELANATGKFSSPLKDEAWAAYESVVDALPLKERRAEYQRSRDQPGIMMQVREKLLELNRPPAERNERASARFVSQFEPR